MKILIQYWERLGDIVRCLPIARHFARQGAEVSFLCKRQYHGIFSAVSYARPVEAANLSKFDRSFDLTIWPLRYASYRASGKKWADFVYGLDPEFTGIDRRPVFDRWPGGDLRAVYPELAAPYVILCPFAYSEAEHHALGDYYRAARKYFPLSALVLLTDEAQQRQLERIGLAPFLRTLTVQSLGHLPGLLRRAEGAMISNTGPAHIAAAVRTSWHYLPKGGAQDDLDYANAVRVELPAPAAPLAPAGGP